MEDNIMSLSILILYSTHYIHVINMYLICHRHHYFIRLTGYTKFHQHNMSNKNFPCCYVPMLAISFATVSYLPTNVWQFVVGQKMSKATKTKTTIITITSYADVVLFLFIHFPRVVHSCIAHFTIDIFLFLCFSLLLIKKWHNKNEMCQLVRQGRLNVRI